MPLGLNICLDKNKGEEGTKEDEKKESCEEKGKDNGWVDKETIGSTEKEFEAQDIEIDEDEWNKE